MARTRYAQLAKEYYWDRISAAHDAAFEVWKEAVKDSSLSEDEVTVEGRFPLLPNGERDVVNGINVYIEMERNTYDPIVKSYTYIGSVINTLPSGKIYAPWTTNQTEKDVRDDESWWNAMTKLTEKHNMSIETGEGSSDDLFIVRYHEYGN